jgi:RND family efflux transporter MFP subunit
MSADHAPPDHRRPRDYRRLRLAGLIGLGVIVALVTFGLISRGVAGRQLKAETIASAIPTVSVIQPAANGGDQGLTLPGDVQADYNAVIHARVSGYLKRWYVDIGAQVKAGQALADIDTPDLDQQLARAKADLATAQANQTLAATTAARWTSLLSRDAVSRQEADEKTGDLAAKTTATDGARAQLQQLQALESFKHIVAPFAGVVTARNTDIGALIAAGNPSDPGLFTVADVHALRIYVHTPQVYAAEVKPGQVATLTVPEYPGRSFQATVASTSGAIGAQSGSLLVELHADNSAGLLKPGDYAQVRFDLPVQPGGVVLPASALMFRQKGEAVATVGPDSHVQFKYVTIAQDQGATVRIASGLSPADRVIDNPPDSIAGGDRVRIAQASASQPGSE